EELVAGLGGRVVAVPGRVGEADKMGEVVVREEAAEIRPRRAIRTVVVAQLARRLRVGPLEAVVQHRPAARRPAEAVARQELERRAADRALPRPAARGTPAHPPPD